MAYWIKIDTPARLAIAPRPRGGDWLEDDLHALRREGVDILVSLLTTEEATELALDDEGAACARAGIEFRNFPIPDRHVPQSTQAFREFIGSLHQERRARISRHIAEQALEAHRFFSPHSLRLTDIWQKTPSISSRKREAYGFPTHRSRWNGSTNSEPALEHPSIEVERLCSIHLNPCRIRMLRIHQNIPLAVYNHRRNR